MKYFFSLLLILCAGLYRAQVISLCGSFYAVSGSSVFVSSTGIPNSSTLVPIALPSGATGGAVGPAFGFPAPNPTIWTIIGGTFWYFNGITFVNTNHSAGIGASNPGGSQNFIYNASPTGQVYKYNGTGNATPIVTFTLPSYLVSDVVGDDLDNFYLLRTQNPAALLVYNPSGIQTCSYSISGIGSSFVASALAIVENTVMVQNTNAYYVGVISGNNVSFTQTASSFTNATDFANCPRVTAFNSTINASPTSTISCNNGTLTLTASTNQSVSAYNWSGPGIIGSNTLQNVQVFVPGTYNCSLTTCEGGTSFATFTVVNGITNPTLTITASKTQICQGDTLTLAAAGASTYTWLPSLSTGSVLTLNPTGNLTYSVIGTDTSGCIGFDTLTVFVNPVPTVSASANPTSLCAGGSATLTSSGASNYTWEPGGMQGALVVVNPGSTTVYTVLTTLGSCTATATTTVLNPASPTLVTSGTTLSCTNPTVLMSVLLGSVNDTISWSGPGIIPPFNSSTFTTNIAGTYTIIVTDTLANCVSIDSVKVVNQIATLNLAIVPSATQICLPGGAPVNLLVSTPAFCTWAPAVDISPATGPFVSASPSVTTSYTVTGTLGVCSGTSAITISVNPNPTVINTSGSPIICSGTQQTMTASGATNYTWVPGNLFGDTVVVMPGSSTVYTIIGESGNCFATDLVSLTVLPVPALTPSVWPHVMCEGNTATLSVNGADSYTWQPGSLSGSAIAVSPSVTASYTVIASNTLGCSSGAVLTVSVLTGPSISAGGSQSLICVGDSVALSANGASSYTWFPGNQTGSLVTVKPAGTTLYTVVASNTACNSSKVIAINVTECSAPAFGVTNLASKPVLAGLDTYRIDFTVTLVNASAYTLGKVVLKSDLKPTFSAPCTYTIINSPQVISKNSGLQANLFFNGTSDIDLLSQSTGILAPGKRDTLVFTALVEPNGFYGQARSSVLGSAEYRVNTMVRDSSNNGFLWDPDNDGDPTNNNRATIIDLDYISFFIPEAFSPNGDGRYDRFEIKGIYGRPVKLTVFNRWGNKVYEKNNYDNSWDGRSNTGGVTFGDGKLPASTYYYILQFLDGKKESKTGFVVLDY